MFIIRFGLLRDFVAVIVNPFACCYSFSDSSCGSVLFPLLRFVLTFFHMPLLPVELLYIDLSAGSARAA